MEEEKITEENKEVGKKLSELITEQGLKVSGMGMLAGNTKKIIEILEKIDKKLYFLEKRQQEWFDNFVKPKV